MRKLPFDLKWIEETAKKWPTPFHVYDAKGIRANAKRLKKAFSWNKGFREYFAVKAAPNPHLMKLLQEFGFGSDCSSMAELVLAEKVGNVHALGERDGGGEGNGRELRRSRTLARGT